MGSDSKTGRRHRWRKMLLPTALVFALMMVAAQPPAAIAAGSVDTASQAATVDGPSAYCYAGQWTQVRTWWHPFGIPYGERYVVNPGVFVEWRWFQDGFPQYWYNTFTSSADIIYTPSWFTSLEFKCAADSPVWVYPLS